jgi:hypothetical protein
VHDFPRSGGIFGTLGWWEYDLHIGFVALIVLVIGFWIAFKRGKLAAHRSAFAAAGIMLLFSLGDVYALIGKSHLPFAGVERVSSRFIIMPFILFLITAVKGIDELLDSWPSVSRPAVLVGVPLMACELMLHSLYWRVGFLERSFQDITKPALSLVANSDSTYAFGVYASWSISFVVLVVVVGLLFRNRNAPKPLQA